METIEQVNEDFNVKKPKKKGSIIAGIIVAVVIIALILVYFLVFAKPQFIFNGAIDKLFSFNSEQYDSIRLESKITASVEAEDSSMQEELAEVQKYVLKFGVQMDTKQKKEIVDLGLEYDNEAVADAKIYYNDGDMYAYFEGLFDKYIKIDMEDEQKKQMDAIFDTVSSEENTKNTEKAMKIVRDELKAQIKEYGEFEKEKATINVGDKEKSVTKSTLTLSQKDLYNIVSSMCLNLAKNDKFLDCFEESPKDSLQEIAEEIKSAKTNSKSNVKISIYTKGILNKLVAVDVEVYSEKEAQTVKMSVVKEEEGSYRYNVSIKATGMTVDAIKGKVEIEKGNENKQSGKIIITAEVIQVGTAKLVVDYSAEYNKGVDKIDTSNSINMNEMTEEDVQSIMKKLMTRPLIGELLMQQQQSSLFNKAETAATETEKQSILQEMIGMMEITDEGKLDYNSIITKMKQKYTVEYSYPNAKITGELGTYNYIVSEEEIKIANELE